MVTTDFRIGLVGLESSHCDAFLDSINGRQTHPGFRITRLAGNTDERGRDLARRFGIPLHDDYREFAGEVDGVIVAHRMGSHHVAPARYFLSLGIPVFVDKPLAGSAKEAMDILCTAEGSGMSCTSFSVIPLQTSFLGLLGIWRSAANPPPSIIEGPCDPAGPWGGIWFYGVHLVESMLKFHGAPPSHVVYNREEGPTHCFRFLDGSGSVRWKLLGHPGFDRSIDLHFPTMEGTKIMPVIPDRDLYSCGVERIVRFLATGDSPVSHQQILMVHTILEAMEDAVGMAGQPVVVREIKSPHEHSRVPSGKYVSTQWTRHQGHRVGRLDR